jgi:hypothetical protein
MRMSDVQRPGTSGGVFIGAIPDRKEGKSQRGEQPDYLSFRHY